MKIAVKQVALSLIVGLFVGALLTHSLERKNFDGPRKRGDYEHRVERFSRQLDLSPEQENKIREILKAQREKFQGLRQEARPRYEAIREETRQKIRDLLNPEQQKKYDALESEREERRTKKSHNSSREDKSQPTGSFH